MRLRLYIAAAVVVGLVAGIVLVLRPWRTLPPGTVRVGDYQPNAATTPIKQWRWMYASADVLAEGKPHAYGRSTWLNPDAIAVWDKDEAHPIAVSRMPDGTWVSRGGLATYCVIRKNVDPPEGWVKVFASWLSDDRVTCND